MVHTIVGTAIAILSPEVSSVKSAAEVLSEMAAANGADFSTFYRSNFPFVFCFGDHMMIVSNSPPLIFQKMEFWRSHYDRVQLPFLFLDDSLISPK
jgi:hypothetical protein